MNESKTVTPEMIDDELVQLISESSGPGNLNTRVIRSILVYLANNPRVPSEEEALEVANNTSLPDKHIGIPSREVQCYDIWQRRAYLKREPKLPEQLKELFVEIPANGFEERDAAKYHNAAVRKAFEIGLANGGKQ